MDFNEYQEKAKKTIQSYGKKEDMDEIIPFLGIIGETGSVISELKKRLRDGRGGYNNYENQLKEELGDVLWYISTIATQNKISLDEIAEYNIEKINDRFTDDKESNFTNYDQKYPKKEQFPDEFEINFKETIKNGHCKIEILDKQGNPIGDPLTDNAHEDDGYRYHDIFHYGYVAYLGWSPVIRKLLGLKRKSDEKTDEVEDGARAAITEELITLYIYSHAQNHQLFKYSDRVDTEVLKSVQKMVSKIEVKDCSASQWEKAIINSYKVYDELKINKGGRVLVSVKNRKLIYLGKY